MELSEEFNVSELCQYMGVSRSGFYKWKNRLQNPAPRTKTLISNILLFKEYHCKYPSHGYRWLNAKIRLDTGLILSDTYAYKCCRTAGIKSQSKHYRYSSCWQMTIHHHRRCSEYRQEIFGLQYLRIFLQL